MALLRAGYAGDAVSNQTLSFDEFYEHMHECRLYMWWNTMRPSQVVIRGLDGDYALASVHRDGDRLVFDLGHKLEEDAQ